MKQHIVSVEVYGDFDIPTSHSTWVGDSQLPVFDEEDITTDEFIKFLRQNGYNKLKTKTYCFDESQVLYRRDTPNWKEIDREIMKKLNGR